MRRRVIFLPLLLAALFIGFRYFAAESFENPETGERHRVALSSDEEAALGMAVYREVLSSAQVRTSGPEVDLVQRVASRLAGATGELHADFEWRVSLVDSPEANAFCLPGGKIVVYSGILPVTRTEAGLAAVMGHEMAHATARHGAQRMLHEQLAQVALLGAQGSLGEMDPAARQQVIALLGAGTRVGVLLPFSRDHESEADEIGLLYMARAGYDPREAVGFWERMAAQSEGGAPPEFLSTHPAHSSRIAGLKAAMPRALAEFEARR